MEKISSSEYAIDSILSRLTWLPPECHIDRFRLHRAFLARFHEECIKVKDWIDGGEWPCLPSPHLAQDRVCHIGNEGW